MKNYNVFKFTKLFFLGIALTATLLTGCSSDDSTPYSTPIVKETVEIKTIAKQEFVIDPQIEASNLTYFWYLNDEVISTEPILKYTLDSAGVHEITLKTVSPSTITLYTYQVSVDKSLDYNYVTLDLTSFDLSDGKETLGGKYWKNTYIGGTYVEHQIFKFSHTAEESWNYWDGFTVSNSTDNLSHSDDGGSVGWINYQWGNMAKGGVKGEGTPYIVGYWGYYMKDWNADPKKFDEEQYSNWVKIGSEDDTYKAVSVSIANHPWPYWGNLNGDGFARKFEKGDYFTITVKGVDKDNNVKPESVTHYLADYRGDELIMSQNWEKVDISALGEVKYIFFQLDTTDADPTVGPNTAVYFCLDAITVDKVDN
ncbi:MULTISPECIES: DUF4465 domain-containing protein [Myroides]|uniref:DUF4465 domain-containing protein n=1 Tax=Myroides albus TaxID=2562892 RepID=A0A6I3LQP7_9FLAO|nr:MULTISPECIES: DUF4465 domain-containing protein [Myroides]MTG99001.1 DUF4465 domain-containing protein [Myroides albus]MVX35765.1 DUF4465 domain-containing protein [Myroides sp. LoEW2-1]UVD78248.1 DUF4465 domain-containing protein [Myroides albus]